MFFVNELVFLLSNNEKNLKDKDINNNNNNEDNNIIKKEYLQKYYEYKNKIMKFKNHLHLNLSP